MVNSTWKYILANEFKQDYFKQVKDFISTEYDQKTIYPIKTDIFNAFWLCPIEETKVVIFAQDPYINEGQAHGLALSVKPGIKIPPSLKNIFKEIESDLGIKPPTHGFLKKWAKQGVLLLNTALTVEAGNSGSHLEIWKPFTRNIVKILNNQDKPIVFMLWGNSAQKYKPLLYNERHLILQSGHPSPLSSRHFFGCKHFSKANEFLKSSGQSPIDWSLNN